jgi:hypothetical protein
LLLNGFPCSHFILLPISTDHNMASNWPLRGTKGTLFDGGVRGVGVVAGGAVPTSRQGLVLDGMLHVSDWYHTILSYAQHHHNASTTEAVMDPPFLLGDGMDVWGYLQGLAASSPRTEVLHEAHPHNSTDGVGNALRAVLDGVQWKVVLRTGRAWPGNSTNVGTSDGWYGGLDSTDPATDGYILPINTTSQNWTVRCGKPPATGVFQNFACEGSRGAGADSSSKACLFNMKADPCEFVDRSADQPAVLKHMLARLDDYRATAVYGPTATHNPDGLGCPAVQTVAGCTGPGSKSPMSCAAKLPCGPKGAA